MGCMRKFLILAFVIFSLTGYFTVSRVATCQAQECDACGEPCIAGPPTGGPIGGLVTALAIVHRAFITPSIDQAQGILETYFKPLTIEFYAGMHPVMDWSIQELSDWFDTFWYYNLRPEMQQMTAELSTANVEQTEALGAFTDAANVIRTRRALDDMAIKDEREQRPSEKVCTAGSLFSSLERASVFSDAYQAYGAGDKQWIAANSAGTSAAHGFAQYLDDRWQNNGGNVEAEIGPGYGYLAGGYVPIWCNAAYNKGYAGCLKDGKLASQDVDVAGLIFAQDTLPLDPEQDQDKYTKGNVDEMVTNLAEAFGKDPVTAGLSGPDGILQSLSYRAKRQVIYDSLFYVISRRVPGGFRDNSKSMQPTGGGGTHLVDLLKEIRKETGEEPSTGCGAGPGCATPDPSRNEVLRALMTQRFQSGKYALGQIDEPENTQRERVVNQALQLMQLSDQMDLMDHYSLLLVSQIGGQIVQRNVFSSASPGAPMLGAPAP